MQAGRAKRPLILSAKERQRLGSMAHRVVLACAAGLDKQAAANKLRGSKGMVGQMARPLIYFTNQWDRRLGTPAWLSQGCT